MTPVLSLLQGTKIDQREETSECANTHLNAVDSFSPNGSYSMISPSRKEKNPLGLMITTYLCLSSSLSSSLSSYVIPFSIKF